MKGIRMSFKFSHGCSAVALLVFSSQVAVADVTSQDVWADWSSYLSSAGYEFTAVEAQSDDTLTISDINVHWAMPDDGGTVSFTMPNLQFVDTGEGTVNVIFPNSFPITYDVTADEEAVSGSVNFTTSGEPVLVAGDPDDMTYTYEAAQIDAALGDLIVDGEAMPADVLKAVFSFSGLKSITHLTLGETRDYDQSYDIQSFDYSVSFDSPEGDDAGSFVGALKTLAFAGKSSVPLEFNAADLPAMLASGFAFDGLFSYASGQTTAVGKDNGDEFEFKSASQGGDFKIVMSNDVLEYDLSQKTDRTVAVFLGHSISNRTVRCRDRAETPSTTDNQR